MKLTRRDAIALGLGATAASFLPMRAVASVEEFVNEFTGGAEIGEGGVTLKAPEIAENGNTVPISVDAPGAEAILLVATKNPTPAVATINFGPLSGAQSVSTRIRLAGTQEVMAIARMSDGSFKKAGQTVKVTIGGCGG